MNAWIIIYSFGFSIVYTWCRYKLNDEYEIRKFPTPDFMLAFFWPLTIIPLCYIFYIHRTVTPNDL